MKYKLGNRELTSAHNSMYNRHQCVIDITHTDNGIGKKKDLKAIDYENSKEPFEPITLQK